MRVLVSALSCNSHHGSEALVGYKYAEALAARHDVTLLASPPVEVPNGATCHTIAAGECNFNDVTPSCLMRFELRQLIRAWRLNRRKPFDFIHRVTPSSIQTATFLSSLGVPLIIGPLLASDPPPQSFRPYLTRAAVRQKRSRFHPQRVMAGLASRLNGRAARKHLHLRKAHKILTGTQVALDQVPAAYRDRCELIPYSGVEHQIFVPPAERSSKSRLELLYVGRIVPYKGLELLLRAAAMVAARVEFRLRVVGSGDSPYGDYCRQLVAELGLSKQVVFVPAVSRSDLPRLYQETDIFCFPTICDTYGIALLEAMSAECAVVVSDVAGPQEIVTEGAGIKVPMHDPEQYIRDYADSVLSLADDQQRRRRLGQTARQRILEHHDWHGITRRILDVHEQL